MSALKVFLSKIKEKLDSLNKMIINRLFLYLKQETSRFSFYELKIESIKNEFSRINTFLIIPIFFLPLFFINSKAFAISAPAFVLLVFISFFEHKKMVKLIKITPFYILHVILPNKKERFETLTQAVLNENTVTTNEDNTIRVRIPRNRILDYPMPPMDHLLTFHIQRETLPPVSCAVAESYSCPGCEEKKENKTYYPDGFLENLCTKCCQNRQKELEEFSTEILLETMKNPIDFTSKYLVKSRSLANLISRLARQDNKTLNPHFLRLIASIPNAKNLPVDFLREIIISFSQKIDTNEGILVPFHLKNDEFLFFLHKNRVDNEKFKEYSPIEIRNVLTKHFNLHDYFHFIRGVHKGIINKPQEFNSILEIINNIEKKTNPILLNLEKIEDKTYHFKVLKTRGDYSQAKKLFNNCVLDYFTKNTDVAILFKNKKPCLCIELDKNQTITEIRGPFNTPALPADFDFVMGCLLKIKRSK